MVDTGRRPSAAWYWVGGAIIAVTSVIGVVWGVTAAVDYFQRANSLQRVRVQGERVLRLSGVGGYTIYYERPGVGSEGCQPSP